MDQLNTYSFLQSTIEGHAKTIQVIIIHIFQLYQKMNHLTFLREQIKYFFIHFNITKNTITFSQTTKYIIYMNKSTVNSKSTVEKVISL
jgi:hypothetical protein